MYESEDIRAGCALTRPASSPPRALRSKVCMAVMAAFIGGCGGGGGSDGPSATVLQEAGIDSAAVSIEASSDDVAAPAADPASSSAPASTPPSAPAQTATNPAVTPDAGTATVAIDRVYLAHSMLFSSDDPKLELIAGRGVLVMVGVTSTTPALAAPPGKLQISDAGGTVRHELTLTSPVALKGAADPVPSFEFFYNVTIPASFVVPGMKIGIDIGDGQQKRSVAPAVGPFTMVKLVTVPIVMGAHQGVMPTDFAAEVTAKHPIGLATEVSHAALTVGSSLPASEDEWKRAMTKVIAKLGAMAVSEGAGTEKHYIGILPKAGSGVVGKGTIGGTALVVADRHGKNPEHFRTTVVHELGHNFGLHHAPCGDAAGADSGYPYQDAHLGDETRYIWGYDPRTRTLIDPRDNMQHDYMSYCETRSSFSDYNYRKMQVNLQGVAGVAPPLTLAAAPALRQSLLLVSGTIADGGVDLMPLKEFEGRPTVLGQGALLLRVTALDGKLIEHRFDASELSDAPQSQSFAFSIPHPGLFSRLQVLRGDQVLLDRLNEVANSGIAFDPQLQVSEAEGKLNLSWDVLGFSYLTVTHVGASRTTLAQDLESGSVQLPLAGVPAGGSFEFIYSDGLNSSRETRRR